MTYFASPKAPNDNGRGKWGCRSVGPHALHMPAQMRPCSTIAVHGVIGCNAKTVLSMLPMALMRLVTLTGRRYGWSQYQLPILNGWT